MTRRSHDHRPRKSRRMFFLSIATLAISVITLILVTTSFFVPSNSSNGVSLGVPDDHLEKFAVAAAAFPESFSVEDDDVGAVNAKKNVRLWKICRNYQSALKPIGKDFSCGPQKTGDCVSWGLARCIENLQAQQMHQGNVERLVDVFRPSLYGIAKVNFSRAGPPGEGAYPDVAVKAWAEMGFMIHEDNPPPYSGALANQWGARGVPQQYLAAMKERAGGTFYPIRSMKELRNAIVNGFPCTIACSFKPGKSYTADGRNCLRWNGRSIGGHQMCVLGYDGSAPSGQCYFWIQNSHGPADGYNAAVKTSNDEPPGGFWIEWDEMEQQMWPTSQVWCINYVAAFKKNNGIDWSEFDQLSD